MKIQMSNLLLVICVIVAVVILAGCSLTFTDNDSLQFNISEPSNESVSLISEFESAEEENMAGDATQKAGSVCTDGQCIIY